MFSLSQAFFLSSLNGHEEVSTLIWVREGVDPDISVDYGDIDCEAWEDEQLFLDHAVAERIKYTLKEVKVDEVVMGEKRLANMGTPLMAAAWGRHKGLYANLLQLGQFFQ